MSTTKRAVLSTTHAIFRGLQDNIKKTITTLPRSVDPALRDGLVQAHLKLSEYFGKFDESPYYTWAACKLFNYIEVSALTSRLILQYSIHESHIKTSKMNMRANLTYSMIWRSRKHPFALVSTWNTRTRHLHLMMKSLRRIDRIRSRGLHRRSTLHPDTHERLTLPSLVTSWMNIFESRPSHPKISPSTRFSGGSHVETCSQISTWWPAMSFAFLVRQYTLIFISTLISFWRFSRCCRTGVLWWPWHNRSSPCKSEATYHSNAYACQS